MYIKELCHTKNVNPHDDDGGDDGGGLADGRINRHCSNLQVANYPTIDHRLWDAADCSVPLRKKAHADSGTLTILARGAATEGAAGGLQVLLDGRADVPENTWVDVPVLPGGVYDGDAAALLVNLGNQTQRWSDDCWRSTKHCVVNPVPAAAASRAAGASNRRLSIAFFHKANYDAVIDPSAFVPGGAVSGRNPPVESGDISRVVLLRAAAARGLDARKASLAYHEELMGAEAAAAAAAATATTTAAEAAGVWEKGRAPALSCSAAAATSRKGDNRVLTWRRRGQ